MCWLNGRWDIGKNRIKHVIAAITFAAGISGRCPTNADDKQGEAAVDRDLAAFVVAGFIDGREQLRSGSWRAFGARRKSVKEGDAGAYERIVRYSGIFDIASKSFRCERDESERLPDGSEKKLGGASIDTPEGGARRLAESETITIDAPGSGRSRRLDSLDVRCIGCINNIGFEKGMRFEALLEEQTGPFNVDRIVDVSRESSEAVRISWVLGDGGYRATIWFDESKGMSPFRFEGSYRKRANVKGDIASREWAPAEDLCSIEWKQIAGVWVPERYMSERRAGVRQPPFLPKSIETLMIEIEWDSVNDFIDPVSFEPREMAAGNRNVTIVDRRSGNPVIISDRSVPNGQVLAEFERQRIAADAKEVNAVPTDREKGRHRMYLTGILVALAGLGGAIMVWRRVRTG